MAATRKENVKDIIIDSTEELLNTHSIDDISLASIAKHAGISKGTLYYHYKSKEDILLDIADRYLDKQWDDLLKWTEDKTKDTSLHRLIKYVIERNVKIGSPRIHLIYNACLGNETIREKVIEKYLKFENMISEKIAERIGEEYADYISWLILMVSDGLIIQKEMGNSAIDIDKFIEKTDNLSKILQK